MESTISNFEVERAELDSLLNSEAFGRGGNISRLLNFVCEKYFQGATDELKECDVAVHALGRSKDFAPQFDAIVRVTAYALRKRLEHYYRTEGADHAVQLCLPPGRYIPKFVRKPEVRTEKLRLGSSRSIEAAGGREASALSVATSELQRIPLESASPESASTARREKTGSVGAAPSSIGNRRFRIRFTVALALTLAAVAGAAFYVWSRAHNAERAAESEAWPSSFRADIAGASVRALVGDARAPYLDTAGQTWTSDTSCSGGSAFSAAPRSIQGTRDSQLFLGGRSGIFNCAFAVPPGVYEAHLFFAETTGLVETSRTVVYSLNGGPLAKLDVVDDAGGDDIATEKVLEGVRPEADGKIHLDFPSSESYLNAIEILPGIPNRALPVRIYAGETSYHDSQGNLWLPNRYYVGGRASRLEVVDTARIPDGGIFSSQWIGHFHYAIPVAPGEKYTVKLHFRESWFGRERGEAGGVGSRIFDVWCNGTVILKNFDIFQEAGSAPLTKTFPHVSPTAQGKIDLQFVPVVNYPSLNAIEVIPE